MKVTKLKLFRIQEGLSQMQASKQLGISRGYLSQLETYYAPLTVEIKIKMAALYNVDVNDIG